MAIADRNSRVVQRADQITRDDFFPSTFDVQAINVASELDYVMNPQKRIYEAKVSLYSEQLHLIGIDIQQKIPKWIYHFEYVTLIIFMVDLSRYDDLSFDEENHLSQSFAVFDSLVNHRAFMRTSIILLLANCSEFKLKISRTPLGNFFPDYSGGSHWDRAVEYIRQQFVQRNRPMHNIYSHVGEADDVGLIRFIRNVAKDVEMGNVLRLAGIC